jgi:hypothetical protein
MNRVQEVFEAPRNIEPGAQRFWLRGLDSNQDNQLQRLVSYQLDDPGIVHGIVADVRGGAQTPSDVRSTRVSAKLIGSIAGEVSEWLKEHAWKACVGEILPWVRIPPSPPYLDGCFLSILRAISIEARVRSIPPWFRARPKR